MSNARGLACRSCQRLWSEQGFQLACPTCRRPLEVAYDLEAMKRVLGRGWPSASAGSILRSVTDDEVAAMIRTLSSQEGLFVEPAGAVAVAGLAKLIAERRIGGLDRVVCTLTGHGLNAPKAAFHTMELPDSVEPAPAAVEAYLAAS